MNAIKIPLPALDQAFDQAMEERSAIETSKEHALGHDHGVRMLRQRFGGQFLRNQGYFITPEQQVQCVQILREEIAHRTAPSPEPALQSRTHPDYWTGYEKGLSAYDRHLTETLAPDAPALVSRRRRQP